MKKEIQVNDVTLLDLANTIFSMKNINTTLDALIFLRLVKEFIKQSVKINAEFNFKISDFFDGYKLLKIACIVDDYAEEHNITSFDEFPKTIQEIIKDLKAFSIIFAD